MVVLGQAGQAGPAPLPRSFLLIQQNGQCGTTILSFLLSWHPLLEHRFARPSYIRPVPDMPSLLRWLRELLFSFFRHARGKALLRPGVPFPARLGSDPSDARLSLLRTLSWSVTNEWYTVATPVMIFFWTGTSMSSLANSKLLATFRDTETSAGSFVQPSGDCRAYRILRLMLLRPWIPTGNVKPFAVWSGRGWLTSVRDSAVLPKQSRPHLGGMTSPA